MTLVSESLNQRLCAFAFCWRLERRDGVTIGLTSHDRPIRARGLLYAQSPGITPGALLRNGEGTGELGDVRGALSSAAIMAADLDAGRWDGATLLLHLTEWTDPGVLWLELARGELGSVEQDGQSYSASLRSGAFTLIERPVAPVTSPTCRARLGDGACTIDLRRHQMVARLVAATGDALTFDGLPDGLFPFGELRWLEGANAGLAQAIIDQEGDTLFLAEAPHLAVAPGARALLTQGCDKRLATCAGRFANAANFRGEPHLPGMDLLTRYPGS